MASGLYTFVAGAKPTATEWNDYIGKQVVMTFASTAARDSALAAVLREGMLTYQTDTNTVTYYTGAAWRMIFRDATTYTPALGGAGWSLGNGTATGRYSISDGWVHFGAVITFGSTSAYAATQPTISLPQTAITDANTGAPSRALINAVLFDATGASHVGRGLLAATTVTPLVGAVSGSFIIDNNVSSTVPFTWTTSDIMTVAGSYELA
jgi:hypothetical protein